MSPSSTATAAKEQEQPDERLRVLDLGEAVGDVGDRDALERDLFVGLGLRLALVDVGRKEDVHLLAHEAGRSPQHRTAAPVAAAEAGFLLQLALRTRERGLTRFERTGWELEQLAPRRLAQLAPEHDALVAVDGHDRHRARVLDDLAVVLAPALDDDVEQLAVVDRARLVRPHATRSLASAPAANAHAKNSGSSSGPRSMCASGRPSHAARQLSAARSGTSGSSRHSCRTVSV